MQAVARNINESVANQHFSMVFDGANVTIATTRGRTLHDPAGAITPASRSRETNYRGGVR
jgi:hypothetical protein